MPVGHLGQMIGFAAEIDPDANYAKYLWIRAKQGDTIKKIAGRRNHPDMADDILALNKGRDVLPHKKLTGHQQRPPVPKLHTTTQRLRAGARIRLPGILKTGEQLAVHAGDQPPTIKTGYAKYDVVPVPGRVGVSRFLGYDPIEIDIPVQFENYAAELGATIENDIKALERMAGRGDYPGAAIGPPAVIRVSVTDNNGNIVPLIPANYQWSRKNTDAPLWRISAISWDAGALRNANGYRVRQTATVTVTQYTPLVFAVRSVARRTATIPSRTTKAAQ
jgi:hypothetical protein